MGGWDMEVDDQAIFLRPPVLGGYATAANTTANAPSVLWTPNTGATYTSAATALSNG